MERQRVKDGLIGAGVALLVLLLVVVLLLWWISDPGGDDGVAEPSPTAGTGRPAGEPPSDLAEGEVWLGDLVLQAGTAVTPDSVLRDVHAVGQDVLTGPDGLVAGGLAVEATVPFEVVAEQLGEGVTVQPGDRGQATVVRTFDFAGREFRVVATGTVEVERGDLVVEPRSIDIGGPALLSSLLGAVARELVTIEHSIEGIPEGLVLQDVTVQDDGFRAELEGQDVRLVP